MRIVCARESARDRKIPRVVIVIIVLAAAAVVAAVAVVIVLVVVVVLALVVVAVVVVGYMCRGIEPSKGRVRCADMLRAWCIFKGRGVPKFQRFPGLVS